MAPCATRGETEDHAKKEQAASCSGSRAEYGAQGHGHDSTKEENFCGWGDGQIGRQDADRDARKGDGKRESTGTHPSAGGGDALDVLQLAAVDDTALHRVIQ